MGKLHMQLQETADQMVMKFFESGIPITNAPKDISFKKSNAVIRTVSALGLLERKIIDACFFIARSKMLSDITHVADLDYYKWLLSFNSNNTEYIKKSITKIQQTLIQLNVVDPNNPDKDFWHSTNYIYDVTITGKKIYFRIPESIRKHLHEPKSWTLLSFKIRNQFTSEYAYILYDRCKSEAYRGATDWMTLKEFREITNAGNPGMYPDFRDLQRRVIKAATDQINEFSDILITAGYKRKGRTITDIRFVIEDNPNYVFGMDKEKLPQNIYDILKNEFGFSNKQIDVVSEMDVSLDEVMEKIEFTRYRMSTKSVGRPDLYLLTALTEDLRLTPADKKIIEKSKKNQVEEAEVEVKKAETMDRGMKKNGRLEEFLGLSEKERQAVIAKFKGSELFSKISRYAKNQIYWEGSPVVKSAFLDFLEVETVQTSTTPA